MNLISYSTNETMRTATIAEVAIALAAGQGHSVGDLHGHPAAIAAAISAAPLAWSDAEDGDVRKAFHRVWSDAVMAVEPDQNRDMLGISSPSLWHRSPRGSVNWDLTGVNPRAWIERSRPGQESMGATGDEVATWYIDGRMVIGARAEARHMKDLARLIQYADPSAAAEARKIAGPMERAEILSALRRAFLAIDPLAIGPDWDAAYAALCAAEAAL
jgi:hypothetical protein